jgi:hypothetical protein
MLIRRNKTFLLLAVAALLSVFPAVTHGQGCVAARGANCPVHGVHGGDMSDDGKWEGSVGYRWLHSDRHFTGAHEERQRKVNPVINDSSYIDLGLNYYVSSRVSLSLGVPFSDHDRSQAVNTANAGLPPTYFRYHNHSGGLGDIRLGANYWVLDPVSPRKWNLLVGVSVDAPTGENDQQGTFFRRVVTGGVATLVTDQYAVDQSIQPGDGGWGITPSIYFYYDFTDKLRGFVNGSYSITPEERSDTETGRGRFNAAGVPNPVATQFERYMSITDSYLGRLGAEYVLWPKWGLALSAANRIEGVPVYDLVGGSDWFRRPGYSISFEPGIMADLKGWRLALYTPIAYYNNREKSVPDLQRGGHGDAAFADYQVLFSVAKKF